MQDISKLQLDPDQEHLRENARPYQHAGREGQWRTTYAQVNDTPIHRIIMGVAEIPASVIMVDHINGDGLDNRRENLRLATASQNAMNRRARSDNKSGVRGVCWDPKSSKWEVRVKLRGVQKFGGRFAELVDAQRAAEKLRAELHGRFARHD